MSQVGCATSEVRQTKEVKTYRRANSWAETRAGGAPYKAPTSSKPPGLTSTAEKRARCTGSASCKDPRVTAATRRYHRYSQLEHVIQPPELQLAPHGVSLFAGSFAADESREDNLRWNTIIVHTTEG